MTTLREAFNHAANTYGVEIPKLNWEIWKDWTKPYRKGDLPFPGGYYVLYIPDDSAERMSHNLSLEEGITVIKARQYKDKPEDVYLLVHVNSLYARELIGNHLYQGSSISLLLG